MAQELEEKVNAQYDTEASMIFYRYIMGGGGDDIHYGVFLTGKEDLRESSHNTKEALLDGARKAGIELESSTRVLDLGSGKGGASRFLAKKFGTHVTCLNLGPKQNEYNKSEAVKAGIGHLIEPVQGSFNEPFPKEWAGQFDLVWSQEAFCHAADRNLLMTQIQTVLKPGGACVFSDIMAGKGGSTESFTGQNATKEMATVESYSNAITTSGLALVEYRDLTTHLGPYFSMMLDVVKDKYDEMIAHGVKKDRLDAYVDDLATRLVKVKQDHFAWGFFVASKSESKL